MKRTVAWILGLGLVLVGCSGKSEAPALSDQNSGVFRAIEEEVFVARCLGKGCHGGSQPGGGLNLSKGKGHGQLVDVPSQRRPERMRVVPGDPAASYLLERLAPGGDAPVMPIMAAALPNADLERIRTWIQDGAKE